MSITLLKIIQKKHAAGCSRRAREDASLAALPEQTLAIARAGCSPPDFVAPLEELELEKIVDRPGWLDGWRRTLLQEELSLITECPVERLYADTFISGGTGAAAN